MRLSAGDKATASWATTLSAGHLFLGHYSGMLTYADVC
jgi:hypothetical protein